MSEYREVKTPDRFDLGVPDLRSETPMCVVNWRLSDGRRVRPDPGPPPRKPGTFWVPEEGERSVLLGEERWNHVEVP